mmetsp:Transcript_84541/g.196583  ORF Transcript_84541/g.196583 Transcript_84541/m.196583 type:complete len:224 (+) Transcript_84541:989-1660(+)
MPVADSARRDLCIYHGFQDAASQLRLASPTSSDGELEAGHIWQHTLLLHCSQQLLCSLGRTYLRIGPQQAVVAVEVRLQFQPDHAREGLHDVQPARRCHVGAQHLNKGKGARLKGAVQVRKELQHSSVVLRQPQRPQCQNEPDLRLDEPALLHCLRKVALSFLHFLDHSHEGREVCLQLLDILGAHSTASKIHLYRCGSGHRRRSLGRITLAPESNSAGRTSL